MAIKCCSGKSVVGLIAVVLFNLLWWVGAGLIWGELYEQTGDSNQFEGAFNSATYYALLTLFVLIVPFTVSVLVKSGWMNNTKVSCFFAALCYLGAGWGFAVQSGSVGTPGAGPFSWVSFDIANINAVRLAWEETNRDCAVDNVVCAANAAKYYEGYPIGVGLQVMGLTGFEGVAKSTVGAKRDDMEILLSGLVISFIAGYGLFMVAAGKNQGMPFKGAVGAATWTPAYQSAVFTSLIALVFGFTATFVLWSSDSAADPSHPFYSNVLGMAVSIFLIVFVAFVGVATEEALYLEIALFASGFFGLGAPVRMWQMCALAKTDDLMQYFNSFAYAAGGNSVAGDVEMERIKIGGVLSVIATFIVMYTACKLLAQDANTIAIDGSTTTTSPLLKSVRAVLTVASFVGVWISVGMLWSLTNDSLEAIDATDSDRGNAAHYYVFLVLFAYFGFFINALDSIFGTGSPDDSMSGALSAKIPFGSLKPLMWVSCGLVTALFAGFLSIGTHDRQMWYLDVSFSNANELRAFIGGPLKAFSEARAYDTQEGAYEEALTAIIIFFLSNSVVYICSLSFPFTVRDTVPSSGFSSLTFWMASISFAMGLIGVCICNSLEMAGPPIHGAGNVTHGDTECSGKFFNMYFSPDYRTESGDACFDGSYLGERFSVNMMNSEPNEAVDYNGARYWQITTFTALAILMAFGNFMGVVCGNGRVVKFSLLIASYQLLSIGYAMNWQGAAGANNVNRVSDQLCTSGDGEGGECQSFKAGFTFFWLQAFFAVIAGGLIVGNSMFTANTLNDTPVCFQCCGCKNKCCKSSSTEEESVEMSNVESRDAITDDL